MRKILTQGEKEKKETRNKLIIGLVLVAIMVLSTVGYSFFSGSEDARAEMSYNGIKFVLNENNLWQFKIQNFEFLTSFNPQETENISAPVLKTISDFYGKPLFFVGSGEAKQEIERNLGDFTSRVQEACIEEKNCKEELPIKNCSDNIIIIEEKEDVKISQEENCVFIFSPYDEQVRAADAFIFKVLGVKGDIF